MSEEKDPLMYLGYILRAISEIEEFTEGGQNDHKTLMAVRKEIEIIGEAANQIPKEMQKCYPDVRWRDVIRTRHRLSHEYFGINAAVIWEVVEKHLPILKQQITDILEQEKKA